jgi:hypothetical protein
VSRRIFLIFGDVCQEEKESGRSCQRSGYGQGRRSLQSAEDCRAQFGTRRGGAFIPGNGYGGQLDMQAFLEQEKNALRERKDAEQFLSRIDNVLINGTELILDRVFHLTGFDRIETETERNKPEC